ncbi:MAG: DUF3488 and transglutaminase-like domain-containing protein [Thermodesulfovibrionales bacterium]|nr:DUF3488 and transglutaminase-like domain-containing protein [Thermodesulfovibrionales bacterium]
MPQRYKLLTALIALAGSVTVIITGELNPFYYFFVFLMIYGYVRLLKNKPQGSRFVIGLSSIWGLLLFLFDIFVITGDYLVSVGHLSLIFHAIKSFDIKEPYDPLQVYFMSLLQLVIASEFTTRMLFGVIIIIFIALFIFAMMMAHYIKASSLRPEEMDKKLQDLSSGAKAELPAITFSSIIFLLIIILVLSSFFFISLPRLKYGLWGKSHVKGIKNAGFSERMDLSSGEVKLDPSVVMRVELRPLIKGSYYWRGVTLDHYDGKVWSNSFVNTRRLIKKVEEEFILKEEVSGLTEQDILLEPVDSDVLFLLDQPLSINIIARRLERDFSGTIYLPGKGARRLHYSVKSSLSSFREGGFAPQYLQMPEFLKEKIRSFTEDILSEKKNIKDKEKALIIESFLKKNYTYSLTVSEPRLETDPVSHFLFVEKRGYCEHYASAMVLMLRSIGIPARIVTGFMGGQINDVGNYVIVRQKDAHSWVEAMIDGKWHRFDPTPPDITSEPGPPRIFLYLDYLKLKWQRYVVSFSREDQKRIIEGLRGFTEYMKAYIEKALIYTEDLLKGISSKITKSPLILISSIFLIFLAWLLGKSIFRRQALKEVSIYYSKFKRLLQSKGSGLHEYSTPGEVLDLGLRSGFPEKELREFISIYESSRFGNKDPDLKKYRALYRRLKESSKLIRIKVSSRD